MISLIYNILFGLTFSLVILLFYLSIQVYYLNKLYRYKGIKKELKVERLSLSDIVGFFGEYNQALKNGTIKEFSKHTKSNESNKVWNSYSKLVRRTKILTIVFFICFVVLAFLGFMIQVST